MEDHKGGSKASLKQNPTQDPAQVRKERIALTNSSQRIHSRPLRSSPQESAESNGSFDIPIYEYHYNAAGIFPKLDTDEFINAVTSLATYHKPNKKYLINNHPSAESTKPEIQNQRIKVIEAIIHQDESLWLELIKNATVTDVQSFLTFFSQKKWPCNPGEIDGIEGHKTWAGIFLFQHSCNEKFGMNLKMDGICGPKTWTAILKVLGFLTKPS
jgi:hypothetical protein